MLIFITVAGIALPHGCPLKVLFCTRFIFFLNDVTKLHLVFTLVFFKDAFNIIVCQGHCGVQFIPFTILYEFPTLGFQHFSGNFELFVLEDVYLCIFVIQMALDAS